ncbi:hypothetical protein CERSUDRAFT_118812, partial [Gelatoporia subvermispora B]
MHAPWSVLAPAHTVCCNCARDAGAHRVPAARLPCENPPALAPGSRAKEAVERGGREGRARVSRPGAARGSGRRAWISCLDAGRSWEASRRRLAVERTGGPEERARATEDGQRARPGASLRVHSLLQLPAGPRVERTRLLETRQSGRGSTCIMDGARRAVNGATARSANIEPRTASPTFVRPIPSQPISSASPFRVPSSIGDTASSCTPPISPRRRPRGPS